MTVFVEEYGHRTGGIPDLWSVSLVTGSAGRVLAKADAATNVDSLWNPETSRALFSEVKGPGDQLSETQKVWIDVLLAAGVGVEVVKVVETKERRDETPDPEDEDSDAVDGAEDADGTSGKKRPKQRKKRRVAGEASRTRSESVKKEGSAVPRGANRPTSRKKKMPKLETAVEASQERGSVQELVLDDSD